MITVDFLSTGGLFTAGNGDAQELTTTFSITSGTNALTCNGASPFVSGDTGKFFQLKGAGSSSPTSDILEGTMTYVSANQVTLSVNATKTLSTASAYLIWGNDDSAGMRAFNDWARSQSDSITLTLGVGAKNFLFASTDNAPPTGRGGGFTWGIPNPVTIQGNGTSSTKFFFTSVVRSSGFCSPNWYKSGNGNWGSASNYVARLDTVNAGSTTVQCKTIADAALFTTDTWALITGLDMQGSGDPPNAHLYEYVYMTDVNTTTGVITFQSALVNTYLDTWPVYQAGIPGNRTDKGGPATLYVLDPGWNVDATFKDLATYNPFGQSPSKCRNITFDNVECLDPYGHFPTGTITTTYKNCDMTSFSPMEVDKLANECVFDNTQTNQLFFQSSINRVTIKNNSVIGSLNGTPRFLSLESGATITGTTAIGVAAYGPCDSVTASDTTFTGAVSYGGYADTGDPTSLLTAYTMDNSGLITMPRSGRANTTSLWGVPGNRCYFVGRETTGGLRLVNWGHMFNVLSTWSDATNIYVQTDWPYSGGFPSWVLRIAVVPAKIADFASTVTGGTAVDIIKRQTALGLTKTGVYSYAELNGATCGVATAGAVYNAPLNTGGRLVSLKVNVTTPYTGDASALNWGKATQTAQSADGSSFLNWDPRFDLRTTGLRTITPSGVTGAVGADSLSAPPTNAWLSCWMSSMQSSRDIRSVYNGNNALGPVFTAELIVDQGPFTPAAVMPLRFRVRAQ
jgi:hypothetical protein